MQRAAETVPCSRCGEAVFLSAPSCSLCGGPNTSWSEAHPEPIRISPEAAVAMQGKLLAWQERYGTLPLIAVLGVLPFFPITPLIGLVVGSLALWKIHNDQAPSAGGKLAIAGLLGGAIWLTIGWTALLRGQAWLGSMLPGFLSGRGAAPGLWF